MTCKPEGRWLTSKVLLMILMSFVLGTSEFVIIGILPEIAEGLGASLAVVGSLVSAFAGAYAVGTPIIAALTAKINRYKLLMVFLVIFFLGNLLSVFAPNAVVMYAARIIVALMSGPILSVMMVFARKLVPPVHLAKAISWIFSGFSIASVLGVPLGTMLAHTFSYRAAFLFVVASAAVLGVLLALILPRDQFEPPVQAGLLRQFGILRDARISLCICMSLFGLGGTYVVYTYFTPILEDVLGFPESSISGLTLLFGICSIISNLASGKVRARWGLKKLPLLYVLQILLFAGMYPALRQRAAGLAALLVMGVLMYIHNTSAQMHFQEVTEQSYPYAETLASSLLPMSSNFGIAVGALCGSLIQERLGFMVLPLFAVLFEAAALLSILGLVRKR